MTRSPSMQRPDLGEVLSALHVVGIPLRTRFRGIDTREVALVEGPCGWGEFGPFPEYGDDEAARWLDAALTAAWQPWPAACRDSVPVNATVPAVAATEVAAVLSRYDGCDTVKVKVAQQGQGLPDDLDRVRAVREIAGSTARIRVDANGAWSSADALEAIDALSRVGLEYVEQPCADVEDLARLRVALARRGLDVAIAADESIRRAADPLRVASLQAADLIVVKVAPLGGVAAALDIVERVGLPAVVSSAIDTSVGIRAGVALAAALPQLPYACGLGTVNLLTDDVAVDPLVPVHGRLGLRDVVLDPAALQRLRVSAQRRHWWRARVARAYAAL